MPNLSDTISGFVGGNDFEVQRTITKIPSGQTLTQAWLTVKHTPQDADPGLLQKTITTSYVAGQGQITDDGATDGTGVARFDLVPADTLALALGTALVFSIKVKTSAGKYYTPCEGTLMAAQDVTAAS